MAASPRSPDLHVVLLSGDLDFESMLDKPTTHLLGVVGQVSLIQLQSFCEYMRPRFTCRTYDLSCASAMHHARMECRL